MLTMWKRCSTCALFMFIVLLAVPGTADELQPMVKQTVDGVSFITGGVGIGERNELKELFKKEYNCRIEIANEKKEYLWKAHIRILNANGNEVFETQTCGPWLLADLQQGSYTAVVTHKNTTKKFKFSVTADKKVAVYAIF